MKKPAPGGDPGRAVAVETQTHTAAPAPETQAPAVFVLRLEPMPGVDGARAFRELLKRARRNHGLRCVSRHEEAGR